MDLPVRSALTDDEMELYAAGFNAWNQLSFNAATEEEEPDDIFSFIKILGGQSVGRVAAQMSYTAVRRDNDWVLAGFSPDGLLGAETSETCFFSLPSAISAEGAVLTVRASESQDSSSQTIIRYPSLHAWTSNTKAHSWACKSPVRQVAAYNTGFAILHQDASVSTFGDARFADCLGRNADDASPADEPGLVSDLSDLGEPVKKVAAGGYAVAALTEGGGLYLWGAQSTGSQGGHQAFGDLSGIPNYVEVDGDKDVQDVALGESHAIALTADGCLYVVGDNTNGQLGLDKDFKGPVESWLKIDFQVPQGWETVGVEAGPRSSFIVTAKSKPK
ncbi:hypothetical protein ACJ41O_006979 [Fusarium nematophilum]